MKGSFGDNDEVIGNITKKIRIMACMETPKQKWRMESMGPCPQQSAMK